MKNIFFFLFTISTLFASAQASRPTFSGLNRVHTLDSNAIMPIVQDSAGVHVNYKASVGQLIQKTLSYIAPGVNTADNGLNKSNDSTFELGGELTLSNTAIKQAWGADSTILNFGTVRSFTGHGFDVRYYNGDSSTFSALTLSNSPYTKDLSLVHYSLQSGNAASFNIRDAIEGSNPRLYPGLIGSSTYGGPGNPHWLSYGFEAWSSRGEANFFITDNNAAHDFGRVTLHCDTDLSSAFIQMYIMDFHTYAGNANHGQHSFEADSNNIRMLWKAAQGSYVYADTTAPSDFHINDSLVFKKPFHGGNLFVVDKDGNMAVPKLPSFDNNAAATVPVGYFYIATGNDVTLPKGIVLQKY